MTIEGRTGVYERTHPLDEDNEPFNESPAKLEVRLGPAGVHIYLRSDLVRTLAQVREERETIDRLQQEISALSLRTSDEDIVRKIADLLEVDLHELGCCEH